MQYLGDYVEDDTVYFMFNTNDASGGSITRATDGTISVYKDNGTTQSTAGVSTTEDFDSLTGVHSVTIDLSSDAFYATGADYAVVLSAATIDGQTVNAVLAHFSIQNRYMRGTDSAATASALATAQTDLDTLTGADGVTLATSQPNYAPNTTTPPTAAAIRAEIDSNSTQLAAIVADTAEIGTAGAGLTNIPWNASWDAEVQSECTDALNAYDPPTNTEMEARTLVAANYATAAALTTVDGVVDDLKSGIIYGSAQTGTLSTTQASTDLTGYADDQLIGRVIIWLSGNCEGEATDITDYANTNGVLTFTALTTAPGNGDLFKIV